MSEVILVTWSSGFIWFHLATRLLKEWNIVIWFDNENDYYDVNLKIARRAELEKFDNFKFYYWDLENYKVLQFIVENHKIDKIVHLAAQAGVRYSMENPQVYIHSNIMGFLNILEIMREYKIWKLVYASSSSVYWWNKKQPFSVTDRVDHPISLYAATKKSNELMASNYSHLFGISAVWLRFFTVYWPYGRPDMATFIFVDKILKWEKIDIYNHWDMKRDFTYVDDIVDWIIKSMDYEYKHEIFNLWNDQPEKLEYLIELIESGLGKDAIKNFMDIQPGDVQSTWSDIEYTKEKLWREPKISLKDGIEKFIDWYKLFYKKDD